MRKAILAVAMAASLRASIALGDQPTAHWLHLQYDAMRQFSIPCTTAYLCEIALEPGERVYDFFSPNATDWTSHTGYSGDGLEPHLVLRPNRDGLKTNVIVYTSRRVYRLYLESISGDVPTYVVFHYDRERRIAQQAEAARHPAPAPAPTPFDPARACAPLPFAYTAAGPQPWRPIRVCSDRAHTFVQLAPTLTVPTDVPIPYARIDGRDQIVNWTYDAPSRLYRIDGAFDMIALQISRRERIEITRHTIAAQIVPSPRPMAAATTAPRAVASKATPGGKHGR